MKQEISAANYLTIQASHFGTDKITHINIPGWKADGNGSKTCAMYDVNKRFFTLVFLKVEDVNFINLDWINGLLQYIHAVNNLRIVGAEVAYVIDVLVLFCFPLKKSYQKILGYSPSKVHLIGYSLGAHLAGEAGSRTPGLGRITGKSALQMGLGFVYIFVYAQNVKYLNAKGSHRSKWLDPTGPGFHNTPNEVRLDLSDANSVDVIHTNEVRFLFELGWRHKLSVKLDGNDVTQGSIFLRVGGTTEKTGEFGVVRQHCEYPVQAYEFYFSLYSGTLKPGMTHTNLIDADINIGNIASIEFIWKELSFEHSQNKLGAEMVIDISGKYGYE
ncbi:hypothetical protein J1605_022091 [Eschrichtius robustus]|uniref:Lipase domain-containing protein n=1 Tax=Eschrichtius robustus TaxID=9764 RepID=A0AB34HD37_ESCRO|nr:hypothetical protein J1605_022091 [Eschrichtius robustus]